MRYKVATASNVPVFHRHHPLPCLIVFFRLYSDLISLKLKHCSARCQALRRPHFTLTSHTHFASSPCYCLLNFLNFFTLSVLLSGIVASPPSLRPRLSPHGSASWRLRVRLPQQLHVRGLLTSFQRVSVAAFGVTCTQSALPNPCGPVSFSYPVPASPMLSSSMHPRF